MESRLVCNDQDEHYEEESASSRRDILPEDADWSLAKQCLSVFLIEVYQCRLCSSFNSTQKLTVTDHLKEKHPAEWLILKDVNNVSVVDGGSQTNPLNQGDLEQMVERELTDGQHTKPDESLTHRSITTIQDSSLVSSSDSSLGGSETTTSDRTCITNSTKSHEQSAEVGQKSNNTAELNEIIPLENGKRKQVVEKRKRKPGRPKTRHSFSQGDGLTTPSERDAERELCESSFLKDLDQSKESPTRFGLRGKRKPRLFKDYVVSNLSKKNSSSIDNLDGIQQVEEETPENEGLEPDLAFQCDECDFQTSKEISLQIHLRSIHHIAMKRPKCPLCFRRFVSDRGLKRHRLLKKCTGRPESKRTDTEVSDKDTGEQNFKCDRCDYNSPSRIGLKIHSHIHKERQQKSFSCKLCSRTFMSLRGVQLHQRSRCASLHVRKKKSRRVNSHQCNLCGRTCKNRKLLLEHQSTHSEIRSHKCDQCPKTYKTLTSLYRHVQKHRDIFHLCDQCGFKTRWKTSLKTHVNLMHAGEESTEFFKCSHCEFKTKNRFYLKHHESIHSDDRPFVCEICGKASKTQMILKVHMETHQNCKYPCTKCDYVGRTKMAIYAHQLVHMSRDQMSYKCEQCSWVGKRKAELQMHYRKHSTAKLYHCGHCGKSYKHKHGLMRHLKEKHPLNDPEHLSALEGLASKEEQNGAHVLNNVHVQDIMDSGQINLEVNSHHLGEAELLQESQDAHQTSTIDQESLHAQASILNGISHIIQSAKGEITRVQGASDIQHSAGVDGSRVVSQIVKQYQIIQDSQVIDHPDGNLNQDECTLDNQVIQQSNVALSSLPVAQFYEITTTDVTGEIQTG